jgi:predicted O-methyltransferase YrrM
MIEDLEKYALENNIPIMQPEGIEFMIDYIKKNNIITILEIGSAIGYSAIRMALINKNIKVYTIERANERYEEAVKNINKFNLNNQITIIHDDAFNVNIVDKFDLIFIDAAKSQYIKFFEKFKANLNDNGSIITDNLSFHGLVAKKERIESKNLRQLVNKIRLYVEFLQENKEFNTEFLDIGDGIAISRKETEI